MLVLSSTKLSRLPQHKAPIQDPQLRVCSSGAVRDIPTPCANERGVHPPPPFVTLVR